MKTFTQLLNDISEAKNEWPASLTPGTAEYKKREAASKEKSGEGSRHKIQRDGDIVRATRKYNSETGESDEPTKSRENAAEAPAKRGRGRPPGKYGSYKKKVAESLEILDTLETQDEIEEFVLSLDEESFEELADYISEALHPNQRVLDKNKNNKLDKEDFKILRGEKKANEGVDEEQLDELSKKTLGKYVKAAAKDAEDAGRDQEHYGHKNDYARGEKRQKGIAKAVDKLTKEEVELDELDEGYEKVVLDFLKTKGIDAEFKYGKLHVDKRNMQKAKSALAKADSFYAKDLQIVAEEVELDENYRVLAQKGIGAERKEDIKVGHGVDYYHPKDGSKHIGKIHHMDDKGYTVKDDKTGEKHKFEYYRKLAEDTEQLDELSKSTLGSYIKKRSNDVATMGAVTRKHAMDSEAAKKDQNYMQARKSDEMSNKAFDKGWKHRQNIAKAVDKITKEEVQQEETNLNESVLKYADFISKEVK